MSALTILAGLVLEDGRRWGDAAHPIQLSDARAVLDPDTTTPYHYLTRARGWSKTGDLAGMSIAVMLEQLPPGSRCYALAADRDQGRLLVESIAGYVARTEGLGGALDLNAYRVTARRSGTTLDVLAADAPGAYGLRPAFLIVDELAQWADTPAPRLLWEAVTTAMAKIVGARMAVLTSAGDPSHWSYRILEHARRDPLWRTHEIPGPPPWIDPERLAEQRRRLPESSYARLFENRWTSAEDHLATQADVMACAILDGPQEFDPGKRPYVMGVDLGVKRDRSVLVVAHAEAAETYWNGPDRIDKGTRLVVDRKLMWKPTTLRPVRLEDVEVAIFQAWESYGCPTLVLDPWQGLGLAQRLRARGVVVQEFSFSATSVGRLASVLFGIIRDHRLAIDVHDTELVDELASVRLRETAPGVYRLDHGSSGHDDQAVAVALAAQHLLAHPASNSRVVQGFYSISRYRRGVVDVVWDDPDELVESLQRAYGVERGAKLALDLSTRQKAAGAWGSRAR